MQLAKWGMIIEKYYQRPMDIEWAKDGHDNKLYIVQARPETIFGEKEKIVYQEYKMQQHAKPLITGVSVGRKIGQGTVRVVLCGGLS